MKRVTRSLPHAVGDLEAVYVTLRSIDRSLWRTRYVLFLWLGMLMLNPFDINSIVSDGPKFVAGVVQYSSEGLSDAGPPQEAAVFCLSTTLTRQDVSSLHLENFIQHAAAVITKVSQSDGNEFAAIGAIKALAAAYKRGDRRLLQDFSGRVFNAILPCFRQNSGRTRRPCGRLAIKLITRVGVALLKPRIMAWCYTRGKQKLLNNEPDGTHIGGYAHWENEDTTLSLEKEECEVVLEAILDALLDGLRDKETNTRWSSAKGLGRVAQRLPHGVADGIVQTVLSTFSDQALIDEDGAWHGSCLALAELSRLGVLLPARLHEAITALSKAISYDQRRGSHHVGAHVRDSACYVAWAFARAYTPRVLAPHLDQLIENILSAAIFDREVHVRRAAGAALQENIGRQGFQAFGTKGIRLTQAVDYFGLGSRERSYAEIAPVVSKLGHFDFLFLHLLHCRVSHWDISIRLLAAKSLAGLVGGLETTAAKRAAFSRCVMFLAPSARGSKELIRRHGSLLALAHVICALQSVADSYHAGKISDIIPKLEASRLYRGKGGEHVRVAACGLIEAAALRSCPLPVKAQLRLLDSLDESSVHPNEAVRVAAARGIRALTWRYFERTNHTGTKANPSERLVCRTVLRYINLANAPANANVSRGACKCLGVLPRRLLMARDSTVDSVLHVLMARARRHDSVAGDKDAETRRDALSALSEVMTTIGSSQITEARISKLITSFAVYACCDFGVDKRGDVGSWARIQGLKASVNLSTTANPHFNVRNVNAKEHVVLNYRKRAKVSFSGDLILHSCSSTPFLERNTTCRWSVKASEYVCCALLRLLGEKLDSVRNIILGLFPIFLHGSPAVPRRREIELTLFTDMGGMDLPARLCSCLLLGSAYHSAVLSGLIILAGSNDSRSSSRFLEALIQHALTFESTPQINLLLANNLILQLYSLLRALSPAWDRSLKLTAEEKNRSSLPILKCTSALIDAGTFARLFYVPMISLTGSGSHCTFPGLIRPLHKLTPSHTNYLAHYLIGALTDFITMPKYATNVPNMCAAADVLLAVFYAGATSAPAGPAGLAAAAAAAATKSALSVILECLCSPYPRVRAYVAEQLYGRLLELSLADDCLLTPKQLLATQDFLESNTWNVEGFPTILQDAISGLAHTLVIKCPFIKWHQTDDHPRVSRNASEFDSYAFLVKDAGF